ncbi:uncharacterized protein V1518DRAFT_408708 [Limtongia smithiae]|uniref:uncharacterized protein n=1 Tax=Limtongia smithiae TaxID=1125753 RepID=UPI0034CE1475
MSASSSRPWPNTHTTRRLFVSLPPLRLNFYFSINDPPHLRCLPLLEALNMSASQNRNGAARAAPVQRIRNFDSDSDEDDDVMPSLPNRTDTVSSALSRSSTVSRIPGGWDDPPSSPDGVAIPLSPPTVATTVPTTAVVAGVSEAVPEKQEAPTNEDELSPDSISYAGQPPRSEPRFEPSFPANAARDRGSFVPTVTTPPLKLNVSAFSNYSSGPASADSSIPSSVMSYDYGGLASVRNDFARHVSGRIQEPESEHDEMNADDDNFSYNSSIQSSRNSVHDDNVNDYDEPIDVDVEYNDLGVEADVEYDGEPETSWPVSSTQIGLRDLSLGENVASAAPSSRASSFENLSERAHTAPSASSNGEPEQPEQPDGASFDNAASDVESTAQNHADEYESMTSASPTQSNFDAQDYYESQRTEPHSATLADGAYDSDEYDDAESNAGPDAEQYDEPTPAVVLHDSTDYETSARDHNDSSSYRERDDSIAETKSLSASSIKSEEHDPAIHSSRYRQDDANYVQDELATNVDILYSNFRKQSNDPQVRMELFVDARNNLVKQDPALRQWLLYMQRNRPDIQPLDRLDHPAPSTRVTSNPHFQQITSNQHFQQANHTIQHAKNIVSNSLSHGLDTFRARSSGSSLKSKFLGSKLNRETAKYDISARGEHGTATSDALPNSQQFFKHCYYAAAKCDWKRDPAIMVYSARVSYDGDAQYDAENPIDYDIDFNTILNAYRDDSDELDDTNQFPAAVDDNFTTGKGPEEKTAPPSTWPTHEKGQRSVSLDAGLVTSLNSTRVIPTRSDSLRDMRTQPSMSRFSTITRSLLNEMSVLDDIGNFDGPESHSLPQLQKDAPSFQVSLVGMQDHPLNSSSTARVHELPKLEISSDEPKQLYSTMLLPTSETSRNEHVLPALPEQNAVKQGQPARSNSNKALPKIPAQALQTVKRKPVPPLEDEQLRTVLQNPDNSKTAPHEKTPPERLPKAPSRRAQFGTKLRDMMQIDSITIPQGVRDRVVSAPHEGAAQAKEMGKKMNLSILKKKLQKLTEDNRPTTQIATTVHPATTTTISTTPIEGVSRQWVDTDEQQRIIPPPPAPPVQPFPSPTKVPIVQRVPVGTTHPTRSVSLGSGSRTSERSANSTIVKDAPTHAESTTEEDGDDADDHYYDAESEDEKFAKEGQIVVNAVPSQPPSITLPSVALNENVNLAVVASVVEDSSSITSSITDQQLTFASGSTQSTPPLVASTSEIVRTSIPSPAPAAVRLFNPQLSIEKDEEISEMPKELVSKAEKRRRRRSSMPEMMGSISFLSHDSLNLATAELTLDGSSGAAATEDAIVKVEEVVTKDSSIATTTTTTTDTEDGEEVSIEIIGPSPVSPTIETMTMTSTMAPLRRLGPPSSQHYRSKSDPHFTKSSTSLSSSPDFSAAEPLGTTGLPSVPMQRPIIGGQQWFPGPPWQQPGWRLNAQPGMTMPIMYTGGGRPPQQRMQQGRLIPPRGMPLRQMQGGSPSGGPQRRGHPPQAGRGQMMMMVPMMVPSNAMGLPMGPQRLPPPQQQQRMMMMQEDMYQYRDYGMYMQPQVGPYRANSGSPGPPLQQRRVPPLQAIPPGQVPYRTEASPQPRVNTAPLPAPQPRRGMFSGFKRIQRAAADDDYSSFIDDGDEEDEDGGGGSGRGGVPPGISQITGARRAGPTGIVAAHMLDSDLFIPTAAPGTGRRRQPR